jgi:hypothetical protein
MIMCGTQAALMTAKHSSEYWNSAFLGLCMSASEADQASRAMLARGQSAKMRSHVAHVAARSKTCPLIRGRFFSPSSP